MFQLLHKFCSQEFNIGIDCKTIQLGTLEYYRESDPNFSITDPFEGFSEVSKGGDSFTLKDEEAYKSGLVAGDPGSGSIEITTQKFSVASPNVYIFSASMENVNHWKEYNSSYIIENVNAFAQTLTNLLGAQLNSNDLDLSFPLSLNDMNAMRIQCAVGPVEYIPKPLNVEDNNAAELIANLRKKDHTYLLKDNKFAHEKEFRMVLFPTANGRIIPVKKSPKILSMNLLEGIVRV